MTGVGNSATPETSAEIPLLAGSLVKCTIGPLHADMESAGVFGAIRRVQQRMRLSHGYLWDAYLRRTPSWVLDKDFVTATNNCNVMHALSALGDLNTVIAAIETRSNLPRMHSKPVPTTGDNIPTQTELTATVRLQYGQMLETYCRYEALEICRVSEMPTSLSEQAAFSTISYDSYLVSLWTQSHAEYLFLLDDMVCILDSTTPIADKKSRDLYIEEADVPAPDLCHVTCFANAPDLSSLYERHTSPKTCSKNSLGMLTLMTRATNAGSRGWETMLDTVLKDGDQALAVSKWCTHILASAFTGLHPCIHPDLRQRWQQRLVIARTSQVYTKLQELRDMASAAPTAFKEVIRLYLATVFSEDAATLAAAVVTHQSEGQLEIPPNATAPTSLQAAMHALAMTGESFINKVPTSGKDIAERISSRMFVEQRSRKKNVTRPSGKIAGVTIPLTYSASWMGGRQGTSNGCYPTALSVMCNITQSAFRGEFVPLWMHAQMNKHRQSRLSQSQYTALHTESAMHKLTCMLDDKVVLQLIRLAMKTPNATLLSFKQVAEMLKLEYENPPGTTDSALAATDAVGASGRNIQDSESAIMSLTPLSAAKIVTFAKCIALRTHIMAYDMGKRTRRMQMQAIWKRMYRTDETLPSESDFMTELPKHATHAFVCTECRRIVNACVDGSMKPVGFNEIGLSASMLRIDGEVKDGHLRCAKRSSAALRTAVALEDASNDAEVECKQCAQLAPKDLRAASIQEMMQSVPVTSAAAPEVTKLRRDTKSCFEQNPCATACGDVPLVTVPLLGRSVRLYGDWHSLCAYCGALFKMTPLTRFRGDPCCTRCDFAMLHGTEKEAEILSKRPKAPAPNCRYCGKPEPESAVNKWKMVYAPLDSCGKNANVPPPLRVCHYCPSHMRTWVNEAHLVMKTPVILCHISARAKPMFGAEVTGRNTLTDEDIPWTSGSRKTARKLKRRQADHAEPKPQKIPRQPSAKTRRKRHVVSVDVGEDVAGRFHTAGSSR